MVEKARTVLLNTNARWHGSIKMELWTYAFRHVVTQWNNTPRKYLQYETLNEKYNGIKRHKLTKHIKGHFKPFHPFVCPVYVLDENL